MAARSPLPGRGSQTLIAQLTKGKAEYRPLQLLRAHRHDGGADDRGRGLGLRRHVVVLYARPRLGGVLTMALLSAPEAEMAPGDGRGAPGRQGFAHVMCCRDSP